MFIESSTMPSGKRILYFSTLSILLLYFLFSGMVYAKSFLAPLATAGVLSLLVLPLNRAMERSFATRPWASLINTLLLFAISLGLLTILSAQVEDLVKRWPDIKETVEPKMEKLKEFVLEYTPLTKEDFKSTENFPSLQQGSGQKNHAVTLFGTILGFFGNYLLTFIYIFFILTYRCHFRNFLLRLFPEEKMDNIHEIIVESARVTQQYLIGKMILILFLAVFYAVGLSLSGVTNVVLISIVASVFSIIPYVGNIIGFAMALIFGYMTSGDIAVLIGISLTFSIGQFVESYIMEPYIVGERVDLHPFFTILVVVLGNLVWGFIGMILAIPLLAMVNVIFLHVPPLRPLGYLLSKEGKIPRT